MGEFNEFPHRLELDRASFRAEPSRPAPLSGPSEKVKAGLAQILPRIEAMKIDSAQSEPQVDSND